MKLLPARLRRVGRLAFFGLTLFVTLAARAENAAGPPALGGTTISAGIADSQAQLNRAMGVPTGFGADSIARFATQYRASGGGPTLTFLGFNPFEFIADGSFRYLYWTAVTLFLGAMATVATFDSLRHRQFIRDHPAENLAKIYFRLLMGVLIITNTPLIYACLMTLNGVLSQSLQTMASHSPNLTGRLQAGSIGTLTLAQARLEAIRQAAARRAVALYPSDGSRDEMIQIGHWYNAMAAALNAALTAAGRPGQLPTLDSTLWGDPSTSDAQVMSSIGRGVLQNFSALITNLAALPADHTDLAIAFPEAQTTPLAPLSRTLAADDARAATAMALPNTPASNAAFESERQLYAKNVLTHTLHYLDTRLLPVIGASPTLAQRTRAWFSEKVEQAAAAVSGLMADLRSLVDWFGRGIGIVLTRMVAFLFTAGVQVLLELNLFVLVLAMPFWLLRATESAFYGVLRSLISLSVVVPAYQFLMLFVDALMGLLLRYILFGPLAVPSDSALQTAGGAAYMVTLAVTTAFGGGELVALVMLCYIVSYVFLAIYMAIKTPKLITLFLRGAGVAGAFASSMATGLLAGVATTLVTAAVASGAAAGGGGLAGALFGSGGGAGSAGGAARGLAAGAASASGGGASPPPSTYRPLSSGQSGGSAGSSGGSSRAPLGSVMSPSVRSTPSAPPPTIARPPAASEPKRESNWGDAIGLGARTFIDSLSAESPGQGVQVAMNNLGQHLKRRAQEEERAYRAQVRADAAHRDHSS